MAHFWKNVLKNDTRQFHSKEKEKEREKQSELEQL